MKRILLRAAQAPFENPNGYQTLIHDKIWSNVGNLLFSQSVYKSLYSKDVQIDIMNQSASRYDAGQLNENYDILVLPFANAFREEYIPKLRNYTNLIEKLNIPVVVTGIGIQYIEPTDTFPFDDDVKAFMNAVLAHSAEVGVRGQCTYDYLKRLGYGNHIRIIGCPSMYMFGDTLPPVADKVSEDAFKVNINMKPEHCEEIKRYLFGIPNATYFPQETKELRYVYCGREFNAAKEPQPLPLKLAEEYGASVLFPVSVQAWIKALQNASMSIGTRIHGSVASILAGVPTYTICYDYRIWELAEYHEIPHCHMRDFDYSQSSYDIYEKTDFTQIHRNHKKRYENYVDFLTKSGLTVQKAPFTEFDEALNAISWWSPVKPIMEVSKKEMLRRTNLYYEHLERRINALKNK